MAGGGNRVDNDLLGQLHHRAVVAIGLVGLEHRELGIVMGADPFVAEHASQFEHPFEAADQQPLQVQLERDPQKQRNVERVVVCFKWPCRRAAGDGVQHGAFHFDEALPRRACRGSRTRSSSG